MNALNIIFNAVSQLTGGLINDITSMVTGMVVLGFIAMGLDHLKYVLDGIMDRRASDKHLERARFSKEAAENSAFGSVEHDWNMAMYRRHLKKSVDAGHRSWRS